MAQDLMKKEFFDMSEKFPSYGNRNFSDHAQKPLVSEDRRHDESCQM